MEDCWFMADSVKSRCEVYMFDFFFLWEKVYMFDSWTTIVTMSMGNLVRQVKDYLKLTYSFADVHKLIIVSTSTFFLRLMNLCF